MKDKYTDAIKKAGFKDVKIIEETSYPIELMANDQTAQAIIEDLEIPPEKAKEVANSVVSIKVYGVKPLKIKEKRK